MEILPDANNLQIKITQKYVDEIIESVSKGSTYLDVPKINFTVIAKFIDFYNLGYQIIKSKKPSNIRIYWGCYDKYKKAKLNKLNNYNNNKPQYMITLPCVESIRKLMFNSFIKKIKELSDNMICYIHVEKDAYYIYTKYCDFNSKKYNINIFKNAVTISWNT
jgi:hypothetical protein